MDKIDVLRKLTFGGTVAEQDDLLMQCFVAHPALGEIVADRRDLVLGAKGAGKSALWKEFKEKQSAYADIRDVHLRLVNNPTGDPEFRDVLLGLAMEKFGEEQMRIGWRVYLLGQFWIAAKHYITDDKERKRIDKLFSKYRLIFSEKASFKQAFAFAMEKAHRLSKVELKWKEGLSFEFASAALEAGGSAAGIPFNQLIEDIDAALILSSGRVWLILDRLDEIIVGNEDKENAVLKGLLLAFRDLSDHRRLRTKIFLRDDVYDRVTSSGQFPALTHINSRAIAPIRWNLEDLLKPCRPASPGQPRNSADA